MKIRNPFDEPDSILELTSLIDVMFLLLIFFLLTTTFEPENKQKVIEIELPITQHSSPQVRNSPIYIGIDKQGGFIINQNKIDKDEIFGELKALVDISEDSLVVISGDRLAPYHAVIFVYDMLQAIGVRHFSHQVQSQ